MNCLFLTQGSSLKMFHGIGQKIANGGKQGFVVADSWNYKRWVEQKPDFENEGHVILKEWEITSQRNRPLNHEWIQKQCDRLDAPDLFNAVISDRRLLMGKRSTYVQDYTRRFSDRELYSILGSGIEAIEDMFDKVSPKVVMGFICVTFLDYLGYVVARSRGIPYLNIRTSRIGNQIFAASTLTDPSPEFQKAFDLINKNRSPLIQDAKDYISQIRHGESKYEGVISPSRKPAKNIFQKKSFASSALNFSKNIFSYKFGNFGSDNHSSGLIEPLIYQVIFNKIRAYQADRLLSSKYVTPKDMSGHRYAFFPLHTEPEVSQLLYGRPFVNQLELVRIIAFSLPADMTLIIKEHPWMIGKRKISTYKKFLNIPRVCFANPSISAREFIVESDLVTVLTSSVGLEATILGKPVLTFGHVPFNILSESMVKKATDLTQLSSIIIELLDNYLNVEEEIENYIAAVLSTSISVNLYSVLLGRENVHSIGNKNYESDLSILSDYIQNILSSETKKTNNFQSNIYQK